MTKLGFVIDQGVCIGCHACTVACKSENDISVGDFRTWVKVVEDGQFPDAQRSFLVERCNHCEAAPCVRICPVNALYKRPDGIVDFNSDQCIGCRACQAACPYDAIYMDAKRGHTVAKCNFCSHRLDQGLEPACVVVCPTQAILFGDLDDPTTIVAKHNADGAVRPREQLGTRPQLAYVGSSIKVMSADRTSERSAPMMTSSWAGSGSSGPPTLSDTAQPHDVFNVPHRSPWHFLVSAYLGTKSIAAGALLFAALAVGLDGQTDRELLGVGGPLIALLFIALTSAFLVIDLERPERFLRILLQPNWGSWLVRGAYILMAFGAISVLWLVLEIAGADGAAEAVAWVSIPIAIAAAVYTAFLFWQAPGRELWQTWVFVPHLLAQAVAAGAAAWLLVVPLAGASRDTHSWLAVALLVGVLVGAAATAIEFSRRGTVHLRRATRMALSGSLALPFWGSIIAGYVLPAALAGVYLLGDTSSAVLVAAGVLALAGQLAHDEVWVRAGQSVPQT